MFRPIDGSNLTHEPRKNRYRPNKGALNPEIHAYSRPNQVYVNQSKGLGNALSGGSFDNASL